MLKCCSKEIRVLEEDFYILDNNAYSSRHVEAGYCTNPKCGVFKAQLTQYNNNIQRWDTINPKKKEAREKLAEWKEERYIPKLDYPKQGTRENMNWLYQENGNIRDFNGTLRERNYNDKQIVTPSFDRELTAVG